MNNWLIIFELNRKKVSLEKLKKSLSIDDDNVLIKKLLFLLEQGIDQLKLTSILSNNTYILRIIYYLNFYPKEKITSSYELISEKLKKKIENTDYRYKDYYQFLQKILRQLEYNFIEKNDEIPLQKNITKPKEKLEIPSFYKEDNYNDFFNLLMIYIMNLNSLSSFFPVIKIGKKAKHFIDINYDLACLNDLEKILHTMIQLIHQKQEKHFNPDYDQYLICLKQEIEKNHHLTIDKQQSVQLSLQEKYRKLVLYQNYLKECKKRCKNVPIDIPQMIIDPKKEEEPGYIITIDDKKTKDIDDAISISKNGYGTTIHVYISDVRDYFTKAIDEKAFDQASCIYLRDYTYHMLPQTIAENYASLMAGESRKVLKYSFYIDLLGNISYQCSQAVINVSERLSYDMVNQILDNSCDNPKKEEVLNLLYQTISSLTYPLDYPFTQKSITSKSRQLVSTYSILTNHFVAKDCLENNYPLIYRNYSDKEHYYSLTNYEKIPYCKITSPIRRYSDALNERLYGYFKFHSNIDDCIYDQIEEKLNLMLPKLTERERLNDDIVKIINQKKKILKLNKK